MSVVVVSYNTCDKLRRCLSCIEPHHEVIVVDNASSDGSLEMVRKEFRSVKLIANSKNRGFGAANNQGLDVATGELALFLNSDAYAEPGAIDLVAKAFEDPNVVGVGGRLLNPDGSLQPSSANALTLWAVFCEQALLEKVFPRSSLLSPYWNSYKYTATAEVEQVMGACLMVRPLQRFDERFFLYCEDTELCKRLRRHGKILYVPDARFTHELGSSSTSIRWESVARYNRGKELYFRIHGGPLAAGACWLLNRMGALLRVLLWMIASVGTVGDPGCTDRVKLFCRVLFAPIGGPRRPAE